MTRLTRLALDHTPITILLMLLVLVGGVVALGSLNQELIPNIEFPQATVLTIWPGASAEEVTLGVTSPIEDAMEAIEDVEVVSVSSQTSESFSAVTIRADYGTTQEALRDAINKELEDLDLPEDVQEPEILLFDFGAIPVASLSVSADIETDALQETVEADVIPPLEMIDGVADVTLVGGGDDQLRVTVDPERMAAAGVTVDSIRNVLSANNLSLPAGTLSANGESIPVQVSNRITGTEALRSLVIAPAGPPGGMPAPAAPTTGTMETMLEDDPELPPIWQVLGAERASQVTPEMMLLAAEDLPDAVSALTVEEVDALRLETLEALPEATIDGLPEDVRTRVLARLGEEAEAAPTEAAPPATEGGDAAAGGEPVTLGDVATIERVTTAADTINRTDGQPSLGLLISKEQSANTVTVVNEILDEIEVLEEDLGLSFNVVFEQGSFIEESLRAVRDEGLLGAVFAVLVILIFLSFSVRSTFVIALSIPLSILAAFLLMRIQGLTINLLTLGGLTIAIGRVVDDAIVVLENIFRHIQRGDDRLAAVLEGTREVATAVTSSTLVAVAVFLPLGFIGGITSEFFLPFALTTTYALLASLVVALTVVPVLSRMFLSRDVLPEERETWLQRLYTPSLEWALDHRWLTLLLAIAFFLLSLIPLRFVPQTFLPEFGEPSLTIDVHLPPGTDLETTDGFAREVEAMLEADEAIETVETSVGRGRQVFGAAGGNDTSQATFFATFATEDRNFVERLTDDDELVPTDVADRIRSSLAELTGEREITYTVSTAAGTGFDSGAYDLQILSEDEEALREANALVLAALQDPENWEADESFLDRFRDEDDDDPVVPILNLSSNLTEARPVLAVSVDPAAALERGLTTAQVGLALRQVLETQELGEIEVRENGDTATLEIVVVYPADTITSAEGLADYQLPGSMGPVRLGDIATVERRPGPVEITRVDGERAAIISGEITDEDTFGVVAQADGIVDDLDFEDRFGEDVVEVGAGVESSQQQEGFRDMLIALPISILIVYLIMVVTFRSLVHPFTILLSLPFAVSGAIIALWVTSRALSVSSLIGLMMLIGIVVANAIVLIDLVQQYRERGMDARTALVRGGRTRLRPILMTAAATVLALTPQALEITGKGGLIASELATTVIGGLVTSTLLTLIVIPVVYSLLDPISRRGDRPGQLVPPPPPQPEPESAEAVPSGVL